MIAVLATILAITGFVVLIRLLWLSSRPSPASTAVTVAAAVLILGLAVLAATGRLHWLAALGAAVFPFLRRLVGMLRFVPLFRQLFAGSLGNQGGEHASGSGQSHRSGGAANRSGEMDAATARQVLELPAGATRQEIVAAHRRLMQKLHPDKGGSSYLAAQLNEAKQVLLRNSK